MSLRNCRARRRSPTGEQGRRGFVIVDLRKRCLGEDFFGGVQGLGNGVDLHAEARRVTHGHADFAEMGDLLFGFVDFRSDELEPVGRLMVVFQAFADRVDAISDRGGKAAVRQAGGLVALLGGGQLFFGAAEFAGNLLAARGSEEFL